MGVRATPVMGLPFARQKWGLTALRAAPGHIFLRFAFAVAALALVLAPRPASASCTQIANCEDLKCAIGLLDEQIAANANNRDDQQRFQESRNTYSKLYNAQCTGQASSGGGVGMSSGQPDNLTAALGLVNGLLQLMERSQTRMPTPQQKRDYVSTQTNEVRQSLASGDCSWAVDRAEAAHRVGGTAETRALLDQANECARDKMEAIQRNAAGTKALASDLSARYAAIAAGTPVPSSFETQDADAACTEKYYQADRGVGVVAGLPACPTDEEAAQYCKVDLPRPGSGEMTPACVLQVKEKTSGSEQCHTWKIKQDLRYRTAYSCLQQRLNEMVDAEKQ